VQQTAAACAGGGAAPRLDVLTGLLPCGRYLRHPFVINLRVLPSAALRGRARSRRQRLWVLRELRARLPDRGRCASRGLPTWPVENILVGENEGHDGGIPPGLGVKRELLGIPVVGGSRSSKMHDIATIAGRHSAVAQVIQQGKQSLDEGGMIIIFPEGTRMAAGESRRYGVGQVARHRRRQSSSCRCAQCRVLGARRA